MKGELTKLRNELYNSMPVGEVGTWDMLQVIKSHIDKMDAIINKMQDDNATTISQMEKMRKLGWVGEYSSIDDALRWIRKEYKLYPAFYCRHMEPKTLGFSLAWGISILDSPYSDLNDFGEDPEKIRDADGVVSYDYDEVMRIALDEALNYLLSDLYQYHTGPCQNGVSYDNWLKSYGSRNI